MGSKTLLDGELRYVADLLGVRFLAYTADVEQEQARERIAGDSDALDGHHESALIATLTQAAKWAPLPGSPAALAFPDGNKPDGSPADRLRRFAWVDIDAAQSYANLARLSAGGTVPSIPQGLDTTEAALAVAAIDYFPVTLIPVPRPERPFGELPVISHARTDAFVHAVESEGALAAMLDSDAVYYTSFFGFTAPGPTRLMGLLVANAEQQVRAYGLDEPRDFVNAAVEGLRVVRALCQDGYVDVKTQVGFGGVELPSGFEAAGPRAGRLRPARDTDLKVPSGVPATIVLETLTTVHLSHGEGPPTSAEFFAGWEQVSLDSDLVSLAGLLAGPEVEGSARGLPLQTWTKVYDPLAAFAGSFTNAPRGTATVTWEPEHLQQLDVWLNRLEDHYHPNIRVAVKRCISAYAERGTPEDALIDLVIALESLFGGRAELRFRISTALAWLLGQNTEMRRAVQRDAKRVYDVRSKLVHGEPLGEAEALQAQRGAEQLVIGAFRALLADRPDLVGDRDRAGKLILGE